MNHLNVADRTLPPPLTVPRLHIAFYNFYKEFWPSIISLCTTGDRPVETIKFLPMVTQAASESCRMSISLVNGL